jgi:hypothetical protein
LNITIGWKLILRATEPISAKKVHLALQMGPKVPVLMRIVFQRVPISENTKKKTNGAGSRVSFLAFLHICYKSEWNVCQ